MHSRRRKPLLFAAAALATVWLVAAVGFGIARKVEVTPETVSRLLRRSKLSELSAPERHRALARLAALLNRLSLEDRRTARLDPGFQAWLMEMTDDEKIELLEATLPTGIGQMLTRFEELPEAERLRALDDAFRRIRTARDGPEPRDPGLLAGTADDGRTNALEALGPEVRDRAIQTGLNTFYSSSSAQTKAELAPLLEELQRGMQSGRFPRAGRRPTP